MNYDAVFQGKGEKLEKVGETAFYVRTEKSGDVDVINEVYVGDCYQLYDLFASGVELRTIFDIGAHIGAFTRLAKELWPRADVYCFEPHPRSYELLKMNLELADLTGVHLIKGAVRYDQASVLVEEAYPGADGVSRTGAGFVVSKSFYDSLEESDNWKNLYKVGDIQTISLDRYVEAWNIEAIDLLKLDCEGSEIDIFSSMSRKTARKVERAVGEYHTSLLEWAALCKRVLPRSLVELRETGERIGMFWGRKIGGRERGKDL